MNTQTLLLLIMIGLIGFIIGRFTAYKSGQRLSDIREPSVDWALFIQRLRERN